jgi:hypothetical protein
VYTGKMQLEEKLYHHINIQDAAINHPDAYGIEVELEGINITPPPASVNALWGTHDDGSLRKLKPGDQAIEYVSRQPYPFARTEAAIHTLFDFLNTPPAKVYDSYRTSIHVHVNFGVETFRTIYNMITLSLILDELLTSQNGDHRIGNNFCLRAKDAFGQVISLVNSIQQQGNVFHMQNNERYSSINFVSLFKFGSIEFRSLECTTHAGRVIQWVGTLAKIKESAKLFKNPIEIIQQFSQLGPQDFLFKILGPYAVKYSRVDGADDMLRNGMRIAQDVAYASAWNERTS